VLSLAQLLEQQPSEAPSCLVEPGLLPPQGILFVGGEPKVGKSLLVANLALSLSEINVSSTSPKKIEANQRNAQLSTGPKSAEGMKISSLNASVVSPKRLELFFPPFS
jgi:Mrp family chromosome partitioning ATPase